MPRKERVNVPIPKEAYPALRKLAQEAKTSAGAVVADMIRLYGREYGERAKQANAAFEELRDSIMRGDTDPVRPAPRRR